MLMCVVLSSPLLNCCGRRPCPRSAPRAVSALSPWRRHLQIPGCARDQWKLLQQLATVPVVTPAPLVSVSHPRQTPRLLVGSSPQGFQGFHRHHRRCEGILLRATCNVPGTSTSKQAAKEREKRREEAKAPPPRRSNHAAKTLLSVLFDPTGLLAPFRSERVRSSVPV